MRAQNQALIKNYMLRTSNQLSSNQLRWKLWNALVAMRRSNYGDNSNQQQMAAEDFVKYIEIDKKFGQMQFIQHSIKQIPSRMKNESTYMLEIDQLLQDRDGKLIKERMTNAEVIDDIRDHGNFLKTFDFFLDNLLCDFSQNVDAVRDYD